MKKKYIISNIPLPSLATSIWFDYRLACGLILVHAMTRLIFAISPIRAYTLFPLLYSIAVLTYSAEVVLYSIGALYLKSFGRTSESGALFGALSVLATSGKTLSVSTVLSPLIFRINLTSMILQWYIFDLKSRSGTPKAVSWILADLSLTAFILLIPAAMKQSQEIAPRTGEEEDPPSVLGNDSVEGETS